MVMKVARFLCGTINVYHKIYQVTRQVSERPDIFQQWHYQYNSSCAQSLATSPYIVLFSQSILWHARQGVDCMA